MTCGSQEQNKIPKAEIEKMGLVNGHAYTLIGCSIYKGTRLLLLRNPVEYIIEWKGKWSDFDSIWTTELRSQLNHNPEQNDGTFFMELDDFRKYFSDIQICYYTDEYQYTSIKQQSNSRNAALIRMSVKEASDYYISVNQQSKKMFSENSNYQYSVCKLLIARINYNNTLEWVACKQCQDREFWVKANLTPGDYLVYVKTYWFDMQPRCFVLSSYGKSQVVFSQASKNQFQQGITESIMKTHPMSKVQAYKENTGLSKNFEIFKNEGFGIFWVKNTTQKAFSTKITLTKMNGLKLRKPFKGNIIQLHVNPGQEGVALFNVNYKGYSLGLQEEYKY